MSPNYRRSLSALFLKSAPAFASALALTAALALWPASAQAASMFIQLYEIDSGHSACLFQCERDTSSSGTLTLGPKTFTRGGTNVIGAAGEVTANTIKANVSSSLGPAVEFDLGMVDTYTVHGSAVGPVSITGTMNVTGFINSVGNGTHQQTAGANAQLYIGSYSELDLGLPSPYSIVSPFDSSDHVIAGPSSQVTNGTPFSVPINLSASFTVAVPVGGTFDVAYELQLLYAIGAIDVGHTATLSFETPAGVSLTSELGFGAQAVATAPVPAALPLFATGLAGLGWLARRRRKAA